MEKGEVNYEIKLSELLEKNLTIPDYQRPYEWKRDNIFTLIDDIMKNFECKEKINLGTIILYKNENNEYEIVDGQQRIITLSLILKILDEKFNSKLFEKEILCVSSMEQRIIKNYYSLKDIIKKLENSSNLDKKIFYNYLENDVKFYLLEATTKEEAFQLFDGRNSKYKDLTPIDLLKAYHLGELPDEYHLEEKKRILENWEKNIRVSQDGICNSMSKIEYLFNCMLFNIYNWSLNKSIRPFTKNDIYLYKGYKDSDNYEYVKYYKSIANNSLQINKPFKAGEGFFKMVEHYIDKLDNIIKEDKLLKKYNNDYGFKYIYYLYYGGLLLFYDKFGEDIPKLKKETIIDYLYRWSLTHRINNKSVTKMSINHYVLSSKFNFFFECSNALTVEELFKLEVDDIKNQPSESEILGELRRNLWNELNYQKD